MQFVNSIEKREENSKHAINVNKFTLFSLISKETSADDQ